MTNNSTNRAAKLTSPANQFRLVTLVCAVIALLAVQLTFTCLATADEKTSTAETAANTPTEIDTDPMRLNDKPKVAEDIGVDDKIGTIIKGDMSFQDHNNDHVRFENLLKGKQPIMLSFNYSNCPKLCSVQLENMTYALREVDFKIDQDFQLVSVSIDPNEQTSRARESCEKFQHMYNQPDLNDGWHFLTGDRKDIENLADQCGFRYKYVPRQKLYSHPPVFILLSPEGKIVRYIHGLDYDPVTIRRALIEAAEGKIGSPINQLAYGLGCFVFDESSGKYTMQAMAIMRIGGGLTAAALLLGLVPYWFFSSRRKQETTDDPTDQHGLPKQAASVS